MLRTKSQVGMFCESWDPGIRDAPEKLQSLWSFHSVTLMDNIKHHKVLLTTWVFGPTLQFSFTLMIFLGKIIHPNWTCRILVSLRLSTKLKTRTPTENHVCYPQKGRNMVEWHGTLLSRSFLSSENTSNRRRLIPRFVFSSRISWTKYVGCFMGAFNMNQPDINHTNMNTRLGQHESTNMF